MRIPSLIQVLSSGVPGRRSDDTFSSGLSVGLKKLVPALLCVLATTLGGLAFTAAPALAAAPEAPVTETPSPIAGTTATFKGELKHGASIKTVTYYFAYSPKEAGTACTTSGATAPGEPFPEAEDNKKVSFAATKLEASTEYIVCLVAANEEGATTGSAVTFKTLASPPVLESETATPVSPFDETLEGQLNPERQEASYHMEYATNAAFTTGVKTLAYGAVGPNVSADQPIGPLETGAVLEAGETYYFRVVSKNAKGEEVKGTPEHFTTETAEAPVIDSETATEVTRTNARLHAMIDPNYQETTYQFKLGTSTSYSLATLPETPGALGGAGFSGELEAAVSLQPELEAQAEQLEANTEYHYEVVATNATGSSQGLTTAGVEDKTFITLPEAPVVKTGGASTLSATSENVSGTVDPNASGSSAAVKAQDATSYYVEYGGSTSYGYATAPASAGEGDTALPETVTLAALEPGTTYHYRLVASSVNNAVEPQRPQVVYGEDATFTTPATPPLASGLSVSGVTQNSATITGTVEANGLATRYELQLGSTPGALQQQASGNTTGAMPLSVTVGSLSPGTVYYYKLIATNQNGTSEPEGSFTTAAVPAFAVAGPPVPISFGPIVNVNAKPRPVPASTKPMTKAQKLSKALKACKRDKSKSKRQSCEQAARKHYGSKKE